MQFDTIGKIGDGRKILEHLVYAVFQELIVTCLLHLDKVRHVDNFLYLRKTLALGVAVLHRFYRSFRHVYSSALWVGLCPFAKSAQRTAIIIHPKSRVCQVLASK